MADLRTGLVLQARSGSHRVDTGDHIVTCQIRGRLKRERLVTDLIAAGDRVVWRPTRPGRGVIEEVLPRDSQLSRLRPGPGRLPVEQVIVANPEQALFIFSVGQPVPNFRMLDRLLVIAEANELPAIVCVTKTDLLDEGQTGDSLFGPYREIGYPVVYSSAAKGHGIEAVRSLLAGKISVLSGPSGAGKSSLLNRIQPDLGLATGDVSLATGKGRHTTVSVRLWPLDEGGFVADTPGLREAGFYDIEPEELSSYFREMSLLLSDCRFSSCTHTHEPGCAVKEAVDDGTIHISRYDSYCRMLWGDG